MTLVCALATSADARILPAFTIELEEALSIEAPQSFAWEGVWADLARLAQLAPDSPPFRELWNGLNTTSGERERAGRKAKDKASTFRARLLRAHLARLAKTPAKPIGEPGTDITFLPGEAWLAAQVLVPGPVRTQAMLEALQEGDRVGSTLRVDFAQELVREDTRELRLEGAERLARDLDARAHSSADADTLARVLTLRGQHANADFVLARQIETTSDVTERRGLLVARAVARLGAAVETEGPPASDVSPDVSALQYLGAAFADGSLRAGFVLADLARAQGSRSRALSVYRALLEADADPAPCWRGIGLEWLSRPDSSLSIRTPVADPVAHADGNRSGIQH